MDAYQGEIQCGVTWISGGWSNFCVLSRGNVAKLQKIFVRLAASIHFQLHLKGTNAMDILIHWGRGASELEAMLNFVLRAKKHLDVQAISSLAFLLKRYSEKNPFELGPYWRYLGIVQQAEAMTPEYLQALAAIERCVMNALTQDRPPALPGDRDSPAAPTKPQLTKAAAGIEKA